MVGAALGTNEKELTLILIYILMTTWQDVQQPQEEEGNGVYFLLNTLQHQIQFTFEGS